MAHLHETHWPVTARFRRPNGHQAMAVEMLEAQDPCIEIAQQPYARETVTTNAKRVLTQNHIDHCLATDHDTSAARFDLKTITRYL